MPCWYRPICSCSPIVPSLNLHMWPHGIQMGPLDQGTPILFHQPLGGYSTLLHWPQLTSFFLQIFIWLCWVLVVAHGIFDLCCSTWGVWLWHVNPSCSVRASVKWPGIEPGPLHWSLESTTGPPGKSQLTSFACTFTFTIFPALGTYLCQVELQPLVSSSQLCLAVTLS